MPGKTLMQAMADGDDLSKLFPSGGGNSVDGTPAPVVVSSEPDKPVTPEPTSVPAGVFSKEEMDHMNPKQAGPEKPEGKEEPPKTIAGSPFVTAEAAVEAYKSGQREIQRLRDQIEKDTPQLIQAGVKAELDRLLTESPPPEPVESEEEKTLRLDDPESYRVLQVEKQAKARAEKQDADMQNLRSLIEEMKDGEKARGITSEFQKVAEAKNIPVSLLMAYGSLKQYAKTSPEDLVDIVVKDFEASGRKLVAVEPESAPKPEPTIAPDTAGLRSPATGVSASVANETIDVSQVGDFGSPGWKELRKKFVDVAYNRLHGGAR